MEQTQDLLFMTYQLKHNEHELDVSYYGCREIVIPDYKRPSYIRGMIEVEGKYIPVIDPNIYYLSQPTQLTNLACILVLEHVCECRSHQRIDLKLLNTEVVMNSLSASLAFRCWYHSGIFTVAIISIICTTGFRSEGDSPAFIYQIHVGLRGLEHPRYGGWVGSLSVKGA